MNKSQRRAAQGKKAAMVSPTRVPDHLKRKTAALSAALTIPILEEPEVADLFGRNEDTSSLRTRF